METSKTWISKNRIILIISISLLLKPCEVGTQAPCPTGCRCQTPGQVSCFNSAVCPQHLGAIFTTVSLTNSQHCPTALSPSSFRSLPHLVSLRLFDMAGYTDMQDGALANTQLLDLTIKKTSLRTFSSRALSGLTTLQTLDLSQNAISALPDHVFQDLGQLTRLSLSDNKLSSLSDGLFTGLDNLTTMDLTRNTISTLNPNCFRPLQKLRSLKLSYNHIASLPNGFLTDLPMTSLIMDHNQLTTIAPDAFTKSSLLAFQLSDNLLTEFPGQALSKLPGQIRALILSGNKIKKLGSDVAQGLQIGRLSLKDNPIKVVESGAFKGSSISGLDLTGTLLTFLPEDVSSALSPRSSLMLSGLRAWECGCQSLWLGNFLASSAGSTAPDCLSTGKPITDGLLYMQSLCTTTTTSTATPTTVTQPSTAFITASTTPTVKSSTSTTTTTSTAIPTTVTQPSTAFITASTTPTVKSSPSTTTTTTTIVPTTPSPPTSDSTPGTSPVITTPSSTTTPPAASTTTSTTTVSSSPSSSKGALSHSSIIPQTLQEGITSPLPDEASTTPTMATKPPVTPFVPPRSRTMSSSTLRYPGTTQHALSHLSHHPADVTSDPNTAGGADEVGRKEAGSSHADDDNTTKLGLILGTAMGLSAAIVAMVLAMCVIRMNTIQKITPLHKSSGHSPGNDSTSDTSSRQQQQERVRDLERGQDSNAGHNTNQQGYNSNRDPTASDTNAVQPDQLFTGSWSWSQTKPPPCPRPVWLPAPNMAV